MTDRKILSLTLSEINNLSSNEIINMIKSSLDSSTIYGEEYTLSIADAIIKKIFLLSKYPNSYQNFYNLITSFDFRNDKYILLSLEKSDLHNLKDLFDIYDKSSNLIDLTFKNNRVLFNEIISGDYDIKSIFSSDISGRFTSTSFIRMLSYLNKDNNRKKVVRALIKPKNHKFIYMVAKMDALVLSNTDDDSSYFDAVLLLFIRNDYRKLLWDYYKRYITSKENEFRYEKEKFRKEFPDELKYLLSYTFFLAIYCYREDSIPNIISNVPDLVKFSFENQDKNHKLVFGELGYEKVKNNTFDSKFDFFALNTEEDLQNLKEAFFNTIYGVNYQQAKNIINNFKELGNNHRWVFRDDDNLIYETIMAMKSLCEMSLSDHNKIDLYRQVYFKYIKKNGLYNPTEVLASVIMEKLTYRLYNNAIELI